jgi:glycogen debranching enzyme
MRAAEIRPEIRHAWYGPSLLVVTPQGECRDDASLTGFYFRETRYLSVLRFDIDGRTPWVCALGGECPEEISLGLVYPELLGGGGGGSGVSKDEVPRDPEGILHRSIDILVTYRVGFERLEVCAWITNRAREETSFELGWRVGADFADLMEALAEERQQNAVVQVRACTSGLCFRYTHSELPLETLVLAHGAPQWEVSGDRIATRLRLPSQATQALGLTVSARDTRDLPDDEGLKARHAARIRWLQNDHTTVHAPGDGSFPGMINQAMQDLGSLALLEGEPSGWLAPAAGMPLYPALFGRDSLTACWQAAVLDRGAMLEATLIRLQALQGTRLDPERDEQPGRIVQQVRQGPLARLGKNPFSRYYGDFASPFMFVISLAQLYAWTGEKKKITRFWDSARRVLDWARKYGDRDGDGYLEYLTLSKQGPTHQGWKDSGDGIVYQDGRSVPAPIGTCEIQGYWFAALELMAVLSWAMGAREDARAYWREAMELKERFNRDWWMPAEKFIALALDPEKRQVRSITSNVGHCVTSGIISKEHLPPVVGRLFAPDLFSGWGIRTLSSQHPSYNPVSYHLGSVWTVENATIAFGLRRFGFDARALDLARALTDLAHLYEHFRVPECIGGYRRAEFPHPSAYPRANVPQAWNQSALPLLLQTILGLQPVAPLNLLVVDPVLPEWLPEVTLKDLRVGGATVTIRFYRQTDGKSHPHILKKRGTLHLIRQPPPESLSVGVVDRFRALIDGILHH